MHIIIDMIAGQVKSTQLTLLSETAQRIVVNYAKALGFKGDIPDKLGDGYPELWEQFYDELKQHLLTTGHDIIWEMNIQPIETE